MDRSGQIRVPRTSASDDHVVLREWCVDDGSSVEAGQVVALCESSKTVFELEAPRSGTLHVRLGEDEHVPVGAVIAYVTAEVGWEWAADEATPPQSFTCSKQATALMESHGISPDVFSGQTLITKTDVEAYLASQAPASVPPATPEGNRVVVVGGSGHAKTCLEILRSRREYEIVGVLDDGMEPGQSVLGVSIIGDLGKLERLVNEGVRWAVLGIGSLFDLAARVRLIERIEGAGLELLTIVHSSAVIEPSAKLGKGVQVHAGAVVSADAVLHDHCVVNTGAIVSHDCVIGTNAHIAPGAILAGSVKVGANALVGMGATVFIGVSIAPGAVVNNGRDVFQD
ncbi:MAG: NeuD/PglB/VioB family sugar acetyltransferase [Vulcanimicrobiota bacterium]